MKEITFLLAVLWGCSALVFGAEEKQRPQSSSEESSKIAAVTEHKMLEPSEMKWGDAPPGLPPGAKMAVLSGDPTKKGSFTVRLQAPAGYKVPPHTHPTAELITVISGTLHLGMGDKFDEAAGRALVAGSFAVMPAGMKHFAWAPGETVLQIHGQGPFEIKYVTPADDPRTAKK